MSVHVVFSDIFTLIAVSVIKEDFSYSIDKSDFFSHFNNTIVSKSSIFLLYITLLNLFQNQSFENCISGSIFNNYS